VRRVIVFGLALAVLAFAALSWWSRGRNAAQVVSIASDTTGTGVRAITLWYAAPDGVTLASERRELPELATLHQRVAALVDALTKDPKRPGTAALPPGTALAHVYLDERGLLTLDLTRGFTRGFAGGSTAEALAVGAIVRTVADDLPEVSRVLIVCGGVPLATLGGHVALDRPLETKDWQ
jgi:hypothetical protein